jgi:hypothetical protein
VTSIEAPHREAITAESVDGVETSYSRPDYDDIHVWLIHFV